MTLRYVFSETGTGLRRNVSMSIALIVTIFVSLTLAGLGLLLNSQATKANQSLGSKLQITVFLCNQNSLSPNCSKADATEEQKAQIRQVLDTNPEAKSYYLQSKQKAFDVYKRVYVSNNSSDQKIYSTVTPDDMQESYWVTLKDPRKFQGLESALRGMPGVDKVIDLRKTLSAVYFWMGLFKWGAIAFAGFLLFAAILQVGNTVRLAVLARRKEIGIMRLVGASTLYISLPFLIETLVAALIGIALSGLAIAAFIQFFVNTKLRGRSQIMEWISWSDGAWAFMWLAVLGIVMTLIPTLVMSRKYLKV